MRRSSIVPPLPLRPNGEWLRPLPPEELRVANKGLKLLSDLVSDAAELAPRCTNKQIRARGPRGESSASSNLVEQELSIVVSFRTNVEASGRTRRNYDIV